MKFERIVQRFISEYRKPARAEMDEFRKLSSRSSMSLAA
jgi:hypothetical protein